MWRSLEVIFSEIKQDAYLHTCMHACVFICVHDRLQEDICICMRPSVYAI